jgi:[NiFe] hydrogenase assembly HybE family chaperone
MNLRVHQNNPEELVTQAYFRIQNERMVDVPILNPVLSVEAVDFQRWQWHWLGMVITPWCMSLLLVPASADNWISAGQNKRRFVKFPAGDFAFLGSNEAELGEYQSCSLFSPMNKFATQLEATMTARASMIGLLRPTTLPNSEADTKKVADKPDLSRRGFLAFRKQ